jgi:Fe-S-cluster containining protein
MFPMRKRLSPVSSEERQYYLNSRKSEEDQRKILSGEFFEEELDIPAVDKLENKIKNEFIEKKFNGKPIDILKKFYECIDEYNKIFRKDMPCKRGCSYCCFIPVSISRLEANNIEHYINKNMINVQKKKMSNQLPTKKFRDEYVDKKCPFLFYDECIIYNVRPFFCRYHFVIEENNTNCKDGKTHTFRDYIFETAYNTIIKYYYIRKNKQKEPYNIDIRDYYE